MLKSAFITWGRALARQLVWCLAEVGYCYYPFQAMVAPEQLHESFRAWRRGPARGGAATPAPARESPGRAAGAVSDAQLAEAERWLWDELKDLMP